MTKRPHNSGKKPRFDITVVIFISFLPVIILLFHFLQDIQNFFNTRDGNLLSFYASVVKTTILDYGQFPLWNPFHCKGGNLILGHYEASWALNPMVLPFVLIFNIMSGIKLAVLCHYVIGFSGAYLLAFHFTEKKYAPFFTASVFTFCSTFTQHFLAGHIHWICFFYTPWYFLFYLKSVKHRHYVIPAALIIVFMLIGGQAAYSAQYTIITTLCFTFFYTIKNKNKKYIESTLFIGFLTLLMGAIFFLPILDFLADYAVPPHGSNDHFKFVDLIKSFFVPVPKMTAMDESGIIEFAFSTHGFHENTFYIGFLPFLVITLGFFTEYKKRRPLIYSMIVLILIGIGNFGIISPYVILKHIPVLGLSHVPQRIFTIVLLFAAVFGALFLSRFEKNDRWLILLIISGVTGSLIINSHLQYIHIFNKTPKIAAKQIIYEVNQATQKGLNPKNFFYLPLPAQHTESLFLTVVMKGSHQDDGTGWVVGKNAKLYFEDDYKGEYYLLNNHGTVTLKKWTPNSLEFILDIRANDTLVINQNYSKHWKRGPGLGIRSYKGLIAVDIEKKSESIVIEYRPSFFIPALLVSLFSVFTGLAVFICFEYRRKHGKKAGENDFITV